MGTCRYSNTLRKISNSSTTHLSSPCTQVFISVGVEHIFYVIDFQLKKAHPDEAIHNEVVGQAHMENYALKVFLYADNEDRAARFNK